ncbi:phosphatase PAP2 family protein [Massilia sp. Se16.2.3]|uniref:phosphatase PAP2 family protein n=1 Tax=Massilia sp. Se16.2.3 TaxID=2709303 RepID=UPI0015FF2B6E|nr:phosphatase PAP2 family protein [Massilia sp. Se16.2.3]QNA98409.1 phosphatase PAP2 family protein [Massilia sp. Se16.2.3]
MRHTDLTQAPALLGARQVARLCAWLALTALVILWIGRCTDIDLMLADAVYDTANHVFPWRHAWLTDTFSHVILKGLLTLAAAYFMLAAAFDAFRPRAARDAASRLRLRVVGLSALLVPLAISALKQTSDAYCPWDLARYGGHAPYLRLFDALPPGVLPGHCLPAGHASSALWLVALCVYWLPGRPGAAGKAALCALAAGGIVGWMQQLRGAHFLTHTLWSVWIACAVVLLVVLALQWQLGYRRQEALAPFIDDPVDEAA